MFGSEYSKHPEILLHSFGQMKNEYKDKVKGEASSSNIGLFQKLYIKIFGIPEIGFQLRSLYFKNTFDKYLKKKNLKYIFDAGSGIGIYSFWLAKHCLNANIEGGEIDDEKLKFCKQFAQELNLKNVRFSYKDLVKMKGVRKFDLIINIDVLEHIKNYKAVLKNFHSLLNDGGYVFIHTPQPDQARAFKQLEKWEHEDHVHEGFTCEQLRGDMVDLGFNIIDMRQTFGFYGSLAWELNHIMLSKNFILAGVFYPLLYLLSKIDLYVNNRQGLGTAILAQKRIIKKHK